MRGVTALLLLGLLLMLLPARVLGQGRLASLQPSFEQSGHVPPAPTTPLGRPALPGVADVLILAAALSLAGVLALKRRSRGGIVLLSLACLLYFGFWRQGCVCPVGSLQNMMQALTDRTYAVPLVVVLFFVLPLIAALLWGRVFCAAVCPLGVLQDVVILRPISLPRQLREVLQLIPYLYLGLTLTLVAGGGGYLICRYDPFVGFFRLGASFAMLLFGGGLLLLGTVVARPYCRFLCPTACCSTAAPNSRGDMSASPRPTACSAACVKRVVPLMRSRRRRRPAPPRRGRGESGAWPSCWLCCLC
jgi:NosR/NirI family nitrous oxide reductase transcriptional regulator